MKQACRIIIAAAGLILCGRAIYYAHDVMEVYVALAVTPLFIVYGSTKEKQ
jgi:hypothetical protein